MKLRIERASGVTGKVQQIDLFSIIILTPDNQRVIVPNSGITSGVIANINAEETRRIDLIVGIGYGDDIRLAKKTLVELVAADSGFLSDPEPAIAVAALADSSVNFIVRPWVKTEDYWDLRLRLTENIKLSFDEKVFLFPIRNRMCICINLLLHNCLYSWGEKKRKQRLTTKCFVENLFSS